MGKKRKQVGALSGGTSIQQAEVVEFDQKRVMKKPKGKEGSESEDSEGSEKDILNVDFEFFDPQSDDFHGLKGLLNTYLDDASWSLSELVDAIIDQPTIGTVVKISEDENPIGVITCLNLHRYRNTKFMEDIKNFLIEKLKNHPVKQKLEALVNSDKKGYGLIISERLINIPFDLAGPLHTALFDEITWGTEDEPTEERRRYCKYDTYLILTRVYLESSQKSSKKKRGVKSTNPQSILDDFIYIKPEDEVFYKLSSWNATFPVQAEAQAARQGKGLRQLRLLMCVSANKVKRFKETIQRLIDEGD